MSEKWNFPDLAAAKQPAFGPARIIRDAFSLSEEQKHCGDGQFYIVHTYGCQANFRNHETICGILESMGFEPTDQLEKASLIILNTCAIRDNAERKVLGELGNMKHFKKNNPHLLIGLGGCMAQQPEIAHKIADDLTFVDFVFGTHNIFQLPQIIYDCMTKAGRQIQVYSGAGSVYEGLPVKRSLAHKGWVEIMDGCDKFCTYCIVPYTRGRQRSRLSRDIIAEIVSLKEKGCREVTLLGQNVNAYGKDLNDPESFSSLLQAAADTGIERIRFMTSHPWDFTDQMCEVIGRYTNIMPAVHLPVQSGNDSILRLMGRRYTTGQYYQLVEKLRSVRADMAVTTDIIVGFPTETDDQFSDTLAFYDKCRYDNAYTFTYSPRPQTPAAAMAGQIEEEVKKQRLQILNEKVDYYSKMANLAYEGKTVPVLVDGASKNDAAKMCGYDPHNKLVNFNNKDGRIGDIINVKITAAMKNSLNGCQQ